MISLPTSMIISEAPEASQLSAWHTVGVWQWRLWKKAFNGAGATENVPSRLQAGGVVLGQPPPHLGATSLLGNGGPLLVPPSKLEDLHQGNSIPHPHGTGMGN